jgi:hypothetical protein
VWEKFCSREVVERGLERLLADTSNRNSSDRQDVGYSCV